MANLDGVIAQVRNRIVVLQRLRAMNPYHKTGSMNKHLKVTRLGDCNDIKALLEYEDYLKGEIENEREDDNTE